MDKERIQQIIQNELRSGGYPFPPELIHAIVKVESNWTPGATNPKSGASGLMQVMEIVVTDYNKSNKTKLLISDLRHKDETSVVNQIKVGLWVLGVFWRGAYKYLQPKTGTVPVDELVKIADMFYVAGPGATKKKLNQLPTPTSAAVAERWPEWVALNHVKKVWSLVDAGAPSWDLAEIDRWLGATPANSNLPTIAGFSDGIGGFVLAAILLLVAWNWFSTERKETNKNDDK